MTVKTMTAEDILRILMAKYESENTRGNFDLCKWIILPELHSEVGFTRRRIDLFVLNCWPSEKYVRIAYEIKISVSDYKNELKHPEKREPFVRFANEFYYVTPVGFLDKYRDHIPHECGLIEISEDGKMKKILKADYREGQPNWEFLLAIARRIYQARGKAFPVIANSLLDSFTQKIEAVESVIEVLNYKIKQDNPSIALLRTAIGDLVNGIAYFKDAAKLNQERTVGIK
jgi:hypothetical protein